MHTAGAEDSGGNGTLNRFRRGMKGHARRGGAGGHAMIDEDDEHGVDHSTFFGGRHAPDDHQINHLGKRDLAEQVLIQVVIAHEDPIELGAAHRGNEFRCVCHIYLLFRV